MKKEPNTNQDALLRLLKRLENGGENARAAAAKEMVQALVRLCGNIEKAALVLGVSLPTVYRWANGSSVPRNIQKIKAVLADPNFENKLRRLSGGWVPAQESGIHSVEFFFARALLALNVYLFQASIEFGFGDSERLLHRLKEIFDRNNELTIHCVFPSQSKAEETLNRFCELATSFEQPWISKIKKHAVNDVEHRMALGLGSTSQIVLQYSSLGIQQVGRILDFLVEVPIRVYENGEPNAFVKRSIWIELPTDQAHASWSCWKSFLETQKILPNGKPQLIA